MSKKVKLILVPHSDDEVIIAAGIIRKALLNNEKVVVAIVTNGDYLTDKTFGMRRIRETIKAMDLLGLDRENIFFLGYGDTGFEEEVSFLYKIYKTEDNKKIFESSCSKYTYGIEGEFEDYHFVKTGKHGLFTRENLVFDLKSLIEDSGADEIYTTSEYELHYDHVALNLFVKEIVREFDEDKKPVIFESVVHSVAGDHNWPNNNGNSLDEFVEPKNQENITGLIWKERICCTLPEYKDNLKRDETIKYHAMLCYESQLKEDVRDYLLSFVKKEEIFWKSVL